MFIWGHSGTKQATRRDSDVLQGRPQTTLGKLLIMHFVYSVLAVGVRLRVEASQRSCPL